MIQSIPKEMKELNNWVVWRKGSKTPVNAVTGYNAKPNDPTTWCNYETASKAVEKGKFSGIGFMFNNNNIVGIDIDHCIDDDGNMSDLANEIIQELNSYTEFSQSNKGIHIYCIGTIPDGANKNMALGLEMYNKARYFAMTGRVYKNFTSIREANKSLKKIYEKYIVKKQENKPIAHFKKSQSKSLNPFQMTEEEAKSFLYEKLEDYLGSQGIDTSRRFRCINPSHPDFHPSMSINKKEIGHPRAFCSSCNSSYDTFDAIGLFENIIDFQQQVKRACEIYGITLTHINTLEEAKKDFSKPYPIKDTINYKSFFNLANQNIDKTDYLINRGISKEVIQKYNLGYIEGWKHPESNKMLPKNVIIIPVTDKSYIARDTNTNIDPRYKILKVGTSELYNTNCLYSQENPVFIVEGELDALSIITAGGQAVALGTVANTNKLLDLYRKKAFKAPLILALDNDKAGTDATEKLEKALKSLKISYIKKDIYGNYKDANEILVKNKLLLIENIKLVEQEANEAVTLTQMIKKAKDIIIPDGITDVGTLTFKTDDLGNAQRLASIYGDIIRYCHETGKWYTYNGTYWKVDDNGAIYRYCWETVRIYQNTALENFQEIRQNTLRGAEKYSPEFQEANAQFKWSKNSAVANRIEAMTKTAGNYKYISQNQLDTQNSFITCNNVTIDLETGKILKHSPEHYITKKINIDYNPEVETPVFDAFLNRIFNNDKDLINFIQIALGYTMTGETREQCFFIAYGTGSNGKSTLFDIISYILDDYTQNIPTAVLMDNQKRGSEASPELARAKGKRFVIASESKDIATLNENQIKALTGGDTVAVRPLYGQGFEYKPTYKIWLGTNHKPLIKGTDNGIWRRVKMIPFSVTIPEAEQDKLLSEELKIEKAGILNWLIKGALKYYKFGLPKNKTVDDATKEYREEMDILGDFLNDCIDHKDGSSITGKTLYETYKNHCYENGLEPISNTSFGRKLIERGFKKEKVGTVYYKNIELTEIGRRLLQGKNSFLPVDNNYIPPEFL